MTQPYILAQNGFTNIETSMITTACSVTFLLCMFVVNRYYAALGYRLGMTLAALLGAERPALSALLRHRRACLFVHARHGGRSHGQLRACVRDFSPFGVFSILTLQSTYRLGRKAPI